MAKKPLCLNCTTTHDLTDGEYIQCMEIPTRSRLQASTPAALVRRVVVEACGAVTAWFGLVRGIIEQVSRAYPEHVRLACNAGDGSEYS